jgi:hypothetical protein
VLSRIGGLFGRQSTAEERVEAVVLDPAQVLVLSARMGARTEDGGAFDAGLRGWFGASHAAREAALLNPGQPVALSTPICASCREWMQRYADWTGQRQVVRDPMRDWMFIPVRANLVENAKRLFHRITLRAV